jgi:outer membrane receptor protein involved in Fe transport
MGKLGYMLASTCVLLLVQQAAADEVQQLPEITVTAKKLDEARNSLSPQTGTSAYTFSSDSINALPQGTATDFNQVLEQAPGVARDSFGQVHVRGEHANLQYRLNGILLPEGITGFGQVLDSGIVGKVTLLTGALPAQYGTRTAGIVDITTKTGAFANDGVVDVFGGSNRTMDLSLSYQGNDGPLNYFFSGNYENTGHGIEPPTGASSPIHDHAIEKRFFGYSSYVVSPISRVSILAGTSIGQFQIPNNPGQDPAYTLSGAPVIASADLNENQREENDYAILAFQGIAGDVNYQIAPYVRNSRVHFMPDLVGDLEYNGVASDVLRTNLAVGIQADGSYQMGDRHTLRAGLILQREDAVADNTSAVFSTEFPFSPGSPSTTPETIVDNSSKIGMTYGVYVQDEWDMTDALTVNYGLRFDAVDAYVKESQLSPRIGLVYALDDATNIHAGYARTFTPPPLELIAPASVAKFNGTTNEAPSPLNDPVKSERAHSFDIGFTHRLTDHLTVGVDGYYKMETNLLDEGQFGTALVFTPFNYAHGRIYGTEFTASYADGPVEAYANLALSRAMGKDVVSGQFNFEPDELAYIASNYVHLDHDQTYTASWGVSYQVLEDTKLSMDGLLGSGLRKGFANTEHLPLYTQFNLGATQQLHIPGQSSGPLLRLAIINVFDKVYEIRDGSGIGVGAPQFGPRRGVFVGLTQHF